MNLLHKYYHILFLLMCIFLQAVFLVTSIKSESLVYDELTYSKAGYEFLKHRDFRADPFNPPFARELIALPLLVNKNILNDPILFWPRIVVVIFSLLLTVVIFQFARELFGTMAGMFAAGMAIFEPNLLANGHYATIDLIVTFLFCLSIYLFYLWRRTFSLKRIIILGIVIGLTLSAKISSLGFFIFTFVGYFIYQYKTKTARTMRKLVIKKRLSIVIFIGTVLLTIWATYFFTSEPLLGYRYDTHRPAIELAKHNPLMKLALTAPVPLGSFFSTIKQIIIFNYSSLYTKNSFFAGTISHDGFYGVFFLPLILIKTSLPLLILFFIGLFTNRKRKKTAIVFIPIAMILLSVAFTHVSLVIRYILPIFPFMIILASSSIIIFRKNAWMPGLFLCFIAWEVFSTVQIAPHYTSYANEFVGGSKNGYRFVADANYDWGQGTITLAKYQREHNNIPIQLAYFGGAYPPSKYGVTYTRIRDASLNEKKKIQKLTWPAKGVVAISATCWYLCHYYDDSLLKNKKPKEVIGGSILLFYESPSP